MAHLPCINPAGWAEIVQVLFADHFQKCLALTSATMMTLTKYPGPLVAMITSYHRSRLCQSSHGHVFSPPAPIRNWATTAASAASFASLRSWAHFPLCEPLLRSSAHPHTFPVSFSKLCNQIFSNWLILFLLILQTNKASICPEMKYYSDVMDSWGENWVSCIIWMNQNRLLALKWYPKANIWFWIWQTHFDTQGNLFKFHFKA